MKINRHLQGSRSDAIHVMPDKVFERGSFPFDKCRLMLSYYLGGKETFFFKALIPASDGFNFQRQSS